MRTAVKLLLLSQQATVISLLQSLNAQVLLRFDETDTMSAVVNDYSGYNRHASRSGTVTINVAGFAGGVGYQFSPLGVVLIPDATNVIKSTVLSAGWTLILAKAATAGQLSDGRYFAFAGDAYRLLTAPANDQVRVDSANENMDSQIGNWVLYGIQHIAGSPSASFVVHRYTIAGGYEVALAETSGTVTYTNAGAIAVGNTAAASRAFDGIIQLYSIVSTMTVAQFQQLARLLGFS